MTYTRLCLCLSEIVTFYRSRWDILHFPATNQIKREKFQKARGGQTKIFIQIKRTKKNRQSSTNQRMKV